MWMARLGRLPKSAMTGDDRDTLGVLQWEFETALAWHRFYWLDSPLSAEGSALSIGVSRLGDLPLRSVADRETYIAMLEKFPDFVDTISGKINGQIARGIFSHHETLAAVIGQMGRMLASPATSYIPAPHRLSLVDQNEASRFTARANRVLEASIVPSLRRLSTVLSEQCLPRAQQTVGLWRNPDGADYYRFLLRFNVTLDIDPEEAHRGALAAVAEADRDLAMLRKEMGVQASARAFHHNLQSDPRWRWKSEEEVKTHLTQALALWGPHLSGFFSHPPQTPYGVAPQPAEYNNVLVNGRYQSPTNNDPRGTYLFNGGDLDTTCWVWGTPFIYHELIPGHHLQLDRVFSSKTLSPLRKSLRLGGSVEGWAEYGRRLALEAGLYDADPMLRYSNRLMDRRMAMMAVADTGMHVKGWSLDRATEYFSANVITKPALQRRAMLAIATEYPGFLLNYWAGGEAYARMRQRIENRTSGTFDRCRFHDVILDGGVLPFPVLEARLDRHFPEG
jgi:uncharacterized protein (DUF885 family)